MKLLRLLAVNLAVFTVIVVALELAFGSWVADNRIRRLNLVVDQVLLFDVEHLYDNGGRAVVYRRDAYGLRGEYDSPDKIDILTMGGSTTDQKYLGEGQTWQDVLRRRFAEEGRAISVVNAGVDGHSTRGHLRSFAWWFPNIPGLAPRYVLFYDGINDSHVQVMRKFDRLLGDEPDSWVDELRERSALYSAWATLVGEHVTRRPVDFAHLRWTDEPLLANHAERLEPSLRLYRRRLARLLELTRELGAEPIVVTQLVRSFKLVDGRILGAMGPGVGNGVDESIKIGLFNRATLEVCRSHDAICIDLASDLISELDDGDFYDFAHTTPAGAEKIGTYLHAALRDRIQ